MTVTCCWSVPWLRGTWEVLISQCCRLTLSQTQAWTIVLEASRKAHKWIVKVAFPEIKCEYLCVCTYTCVTLLYPGPHASAQEHNSIDLLLLAGCLSQLLHLFIQLCELDYIRNIRKSEICYFQRGDTYKAIWCCPKCPFTTNLITQLTCLTLGDLQSMATVPFWPAH